MKIDVPPLWFGAVAAYPCTQHDSIRLLENFTLLSRFGEPVPLATYDQRRSLLYVPRRLAPMEGDDRRYSGPEINFISSVVYRNPEQEKFTDNCLEFLLNDESLIAQASTGFGKTVLAMKIIEAVGLSTLIVVHKEDLVKQWRAALSEFLGLTPKEIGLIRQDTVRVAGCPVTIAMLQSVSILDRYPSWIREAFGFVIFDEVHRLAAETFSRAASLFNSKLRLGMSATAKRRDGKEFVFEAHIGPVRVLSKLIAVPPKVLRFSTEWKVPMVPRRDKSTGKVYLIPLPHKAGKLGHVLKHLSQDLRRNDLLAGFVYSSYKKDRNVVFFSDRLAHLDQVKAMVRGKGVPTIDMALYVGGMTDKERDHAAGKRVIFATYKMMEEGTDIPWLDTCVMGTPRANVEQLVGRILREYPGKKEPVVFDLIDVNSPVFVGYSRTRDRTYAKLGGQVKYME